MAWISTRRTHPTGQLRHPAKAKMSWSRFVAWRIYVSADNAVYRRNQQSRKLKPIGRKTSIWGGLDLTTDQTR
ncbi:hypothetical protein NXT3_PC00149 (plasmid) [Sinorhizobium fredii]|uniref:Uncharacterized protein n=1 Tax=Rhizobium fredii TaxID=380 RepID=A0A2L0HCY4_RHIFR|nr:hypothetical protein NXT3_PC00149 [Sinorhizobium fredii]